MEQEQLKSVLESLLFVASRPMKAKDFAKILTLDAGAVKTALDSLVQDRKDSGIVLLNSNEEYQLSTNIHNSSQVKNFLNAELREKLTDATVEVLAIIAYRQPISKAEIEAIRGVNSQYSVRHLLMRGLIEKVPNPVDARSFLYKTTTEFLMHLGLTTVNDLPEFDKLVEQIKLPETPGLAQTQSPDAPTETQTPAIPSIESDITVVVPPVEIPAKPSESLPNEIQPAESSEQAEGEDLEEEDDEDEDDE